MRDSERQRRGKFGEQPGLHRQLLLREFLLGKAEEQVAIDHPGNAVLAFGQIFERIHDEVGKSFRNRRQVGFTVVIEHRYHSIKEETMSKGTNGRHASFLQDGRAGMRSNTCLVSSIARCGDHRAMSLIVYTVFRALTTR